MRMRKLIPRKREDYHQDALKEMQPFISGIAAAISERATIFVKSLKHVEMISQQQLFTWKYEIKEPSISPICSKIMNESQNYSAFRCYDCMESISSCICAQCFQNGNHKGHNFVQYQAINGCCDCGNEQSWNQKGFCRSHGKSNQTKCIIPAQMENLYLKQFRLAFWIYFRFVAFKRAQQYRQRYGNALFGFLIMLSQQNYQMKNLASILLTTPLTQEYKGQDNEFNVPLLHRIFQLSREHEELNKFVSLTFEVFPVEEFRAAVIHEYFAKMDEEEEAFTRNHPLATLNFQFLSCVKLINKLISNNTLSPLHLNSKSSFPPLALAEAFKKYYQDLDYIKNMRCSKQYHIIHLSTTNLCQMMFYRNHTTYSKSKSLQNEEIMALNLDEFFLKTFGNFVKNILNQKNLIEKCLRDVMDYICLAQVNSISLVHERTFALLTLAYFQGNLYELLNEEKRKDFISLIFVKGFIKIQQIVQKSLLTKLQIQQKSQYSPQYHSHQRYFLSLYPQKNFNQFLDTIFHKILMIFCQGDYSDVVQIILKRLLGELNSIQEENEKDELEEERRITLHYKKLFGLLNFTNTVTQINLDQLVIANYIGLAKPQQIYQFFGRLAASFKNLAVRDFKKLSISIMNSQQHLQKFIKQHCTIEKGRLKCLKQAKPLQTFVYDEIFNNYEKKLNEVEVNFLSSKMRLPQFQNFTTFNSESVELIIQAAMNYIFKFSASPTNSALPQVFSKICFQILKIYLLDKSHPNKYKPFFLSLLQPGVRKLISKELLEQITQIEKNEDLQNERGRIKDQKVLSDKQRREKLLAKKKQKQLSLKNNQARILNAYDPQINKLEASENVEHCIYCKQGKNEELNYISYVGLTNFYEQQLLKSNSYHIYFQSCGHKIHKSCFELVMIKNRSNYCFLCKQQTNVLIPDASTAPAKTNEVQSMDILSSYHAVLINQREEIKPELKEADPFLIQSQATFYQLILDGLCKDILFLALHNLQTYKRNKYPIHYQLYLILKALPSTIIKDTFIKIRPKSKHKVNYILEYIQFKFSQLFFGEMEERNFKQINFEQVQQINLFFTFFTNPKSEILLKGLKLIVNEQIFLKMPQLLSEMSEYMGECKTCRHITNYIYICFKCGWSCCRKCLTLMYKHSTYQHLDGTIFISCTNGGIKYLHAGSIFQDDSLYQNYLGQSYREITCQIEMAKCEKFTLNAQKMEMLQRMAMGYGIHQKIFLNES